MTATLALFVRAAAAVGGLLLATAATAVAADEYKLGPDSLPQKDVPQGTIKGPFPWKSDIFPGTVRDYWVYVPAQYDAAKPACVFVAQDGLGLANAWKLPTVFDNLIHKQEMPVTIGIFVSPGVVPAPHADAQPRFNRSFEYDALGDRYARFLIEEILPAVSKDYALSADPNDRAIAGSSSGGICAFNVAWERPDQFRRVFSAVGTFVSLRGGHELPALVRQTEPKPLRVFLQDGTNDLNHWAGNWWVSNQDMLSALEFSGYEVNHAWGTEGHNSKHAAAIMPDAVRWLWQGYPEPVKTGRAAKRVNDILIPGEGWRMVAEGYKFTEGPAVNDRGELFFTDIPNSRIHKVGLDGKVSTFAEDTGNANGLMFGADGRLYACANGKKQIVAYAPDGTATVLAENVTSNDLVVGTTGVHFTDPANKKVFHLDAKNQVREVDSGIERPNGIVLSPDQTLLYVADSLGQFVYSFQVQPDGSLKHKQPFYHLRLPHGVGTSGADGMTVDVDGRLYVTTRIGLQVLDPPGRVHVTLLKPQNAGLSNVVFGGPNLDVLYVTSGDKVYQRKVNAKGALPLRGPLKPPRPQL